MRIALRASFLSLTLFAALSTPAIALEVIFGNTGVGNNGLNLGGDFDLLAQGFTMGSKSYELSAIQIAFQFNATKPTNTQLLISLYSGGTTPNGGTLMGTFDSASHIPTDKNESAQLYTFASYTGDRTLAANTTYWLVVENFGGPLFKWHYAADDLGGQNYTPVAQNDSGVTYPVGGTPSIPIGTQGIEFAGGNWENLSANFSGLRFSIVPEPSTYALGAIGTLVMGVVARRKSRKAVKA